MKANKTNFLLLLLLINFSAGAQCLVQVANFDQNTCANSTIELLAYPDDYSQVYTYSWAGPNGFSSSGQYIYIPNAQPEHSGSYMVTMTSSAGCSSQMEVVVVKNPTPVVYTGGQQGGCFGTSTEIFALDISGEYGPYSYSWDGGQTSQSILVSHYSNYPAPGCLITNSYGCSAMNNTTFMIITYPSPAKPVIATADPVTFCQGGQALLTVQNPETFHQYQWRKFANDVAGANSISFAAKQSARYRVVTTNAYGCTSLSAQIQITVNPKPVAEISVNGSTFLCNGDSVLLSANSGSNLSYQWTRYNAIMNGKTNQSITVKNKGNYKVVVTNEFGCSKTSGMVAVEVTACRIGEETADVDPVAVYPNPSTEYFQIKLSDETENALVKIIDLSGRIMEEGKVAKEFEFGMHYPAGTYILFAEVNGRVIQKKVVKSE
ncbi:MAG: T9SS type A sorting domain-containing protein [Bacteroidia bacterium]|nr:T9SS type A sorting domain-containing protein [Bacteroidia bacterium]